MSKGKKSEKADAIFFKIGTMVFMPLLFESVYTEYLKWIQSFKTSLSRNLTYKTNFLLLMVTPAFVFFAIQYNLWTSIYMTNSYGNLRGYSLPQMIEYQFWIFIFQLFVRSHFFSQNISSSIRLGRISAFLLYPFGFISYHFTLFLSDKLLQAFIGCFSLGLALFFSWVEVPQMSLLGKALVFICLMNVFWFFTQMIIGFVSFWLEETWSINVSVRFIAAFLSGAMIPLDFFPDFLTKILIWTPFPHLTYIPVRIMMGEKMDLSFSLIILSTWILVLFFLSGWIWKRGLRLYTGSGI